MAKIVWSFFSTVTLKLNNNKAIMHSHTSLGSFKISTQYFNPLFSLFETALPRRSLNFFLLETYIFKTLKLTDLYY